MKVALLNVKYSPNLGDGLLSECLERELSVALGGAEVFSIDIAGRTAFPTIAPGHRGAALAVLEAMPPALRAVAVRTALGALARVRLRGHVRRQIAGCDAAVLGGGNLFADADLNFPVKVSTALAEAARIPIPVAVFGVGASSGWSPLGARLFSSALARARLAFVSVRDTRSQGIWADLLSSRGIPAAGLVHDPGLLASRHYPAAPRSKDVRLVGLCITHPLALRYHAGTGHSADLGSWYGEVAAALVADGWRVALFTNGSPEDRAYLAENGAAWIRRAKGPVTMTTPFSTPAELARFVSGCDGVIAHRMHACIAAHSFAVPTVGLCWDPKLDAFFALAGRSTFVADPASVDGRGMAALVARAVEQGVDRPALDRTIAAAQGDVARLAAALRASLPRPDAEAA